jgi:5-methylcytosine-specific restriction endonuclease McrA
MLDTSLTEIKMWASWWENPDSPPKIIPIEKALDELNFGAVVTAKDSILLTKKKRPVRDIVMDRDGYICYFCCEYGDTLEHLQPTSKGGKTSVENCVCACSKCNGQKGNMTESEYWKFLADDYVAKQKYKKLMKEIFSSPRN